MRKMLFLPSTSVSHNLNRQKLLKRLGNRKRINIGNRVGRSNPTASKQKKLSDLLRPRNALSLLHLIKPGSSIKIIQDGQFNPPRYTAHVEYNNGILATGTGPSKIQAKAIAAENVLKNLVSDYTSLQSLENIDDKNLQNYEENSSLIPLASFALHKLFNEWAMAKDIIALPKVNLPVRSVKDPVPRKELPPNALEIHPSSLINIMMPGTSPFEVRRTEGPDVKVTWGYKIDGIIYTGTARNKKDARKEAAKAVLFKFYGLDYSNPY